MVPSPQVHEAGAHWPDASHAVGAGYGALQVEVAASDDVQASPPAVNTTSANVNKARRSRRAIFATVA
jgi:hypothetical protein